MSGTRGLTAWGKYRKTGDQAGQKEKQEVGQKGDRRNDKGTCSGWESICSAKPQVATTKGLRDAQQGGGVGCVGATLLHQL